MRKFLVILLLPIFLKSVQVVSTENQGLIEVVFDIRNKKDYEILEGLLTFGETLANIKESKESH